MPAMQLKTTVVTAGDRVPLAPAPTKCAWASVLADPGNTGNIYLGTNLVSSSAYGTALPPGETFFFPVLSGENPYELSQMEIDADNSGNSVRILYYVN